MGYKYLKINILFLFFFCACHLVQAQLVVVSSYQNDSNPLGDPRGEYTELLVVSDNVNMEGWTLRDNNASQRSWQTPIKFSNSSFWNNMRAGTIIVIWHRKISTDGTTAHPQDVNKNDGYIEVWANDPTYFTGGLFGSSPSFSGSTLNLANSADIIQLRNASGAHIHALGHKLTPDTCFINLPLPKLNHEISGLSTAAADAVMVCPGATLADYNGIAPSYSGTTRTAISTAKVSGLPNQCTSSSTANSVFWRSLREPVWNAPTSPSPNYTFTAPNGITLNWNAAVDPNPSDLTQGYLVLRNTINSFTPPVDGRTYNTGNLIGTATVVAHINSSTITTHSETFSLACDEKVYYRVYAWRYATDDKNGNNYDQARGRAYNETSFAEFEVTHTSDLACTNIVSTPVTCHNGTDGSITLNPENGTPPYSYSWTPNVSTTQTATGLASGSYSCQISDQAGCSITVNVPLSNPAPVTFATSSTNASCGNSNGSITVNSETGGTPPYQYSIDNGLTWQSSSVFNSLAAGSYPVKIKDANQCEATAQNIPISNTGSTLSATFTTTPISCHNGADGSITLSPSNGTLPYSYAWTPNVSSTQTATGLSAGNYSCQISDATGCSITENVAISNPQQITFSHTSTQTFCLNDNGTITISNEAGGTPPYQYSIDNGVTWQSSPVFLNLIVGNYPVKVKDANSCETTAVNISITNTTSGFSASFTVQHLTCFNGSDGEIVINTSNGTLPYSYQWTPNVSSSQIATGLVVGVYHCEVSDATGCTIIFDIDVTGPPELGFLQSATDASCGNNDGSITISNESGGVPPYQYSNNNGTFWQPNNVFSYLAAGTYLVKMKDANGCETPAQSVVVANDASTLASSHTVKNVSCYNDSDGEITVTASDGIPPYTYQWTPNVSSSQAATGLAAGNYSCQISDATGCSVTENIAITEPPVLDASTTTTPSDIGLNNGSITVTATGGTPGYQYSIDGTNWQTSNLFANLAGGSYILEVRDANSCQFTIVATVGSTSSTFTVDVLVDTVSCFGGNNGRLTLQASGGSGDFSYQWHTSPPQFNNVLSNLVSGTYSFTVTDNISLETYTNSVYLPQASRIIVISLLTIPATCAASDGEITIAPVYGTAPFEYSIDGGLTWSSSGVFTGLPANSYMAKIKDAIGCIDSTSMALPNTTSLTASIQPSNVKNISCYGKNDGSALTQARSGSAPYIFSWNTSPAQTDSLASNLPKGDFICTVTDQDGCIAICTVSITEPDSLAVDSTRIVPSLCKDGGSFAIFVQGGVSPYDYSYDGGITWETNIKTGLAPKSHAVIVKDAKGCFLNNGNLSFDIPEIRPNVLLNMAEDTLCFAEGLVLEADPSSDPYVWQNGSNSPTCPVPDIGWYWIKASLSATCASFDSVLVVLCSLSNSKLLIPNAFTPNGDGMNDVFSIICTGMDNDFENNFQMQIYNKWGEVIFDTKSPADGWDGKSKGEKCPSGVYTYLIKYLDKSAGNKLKTVRGSVLLLE